jgi:short-subunit dehydrogenase
VVALSEGLRRELSDRNIGVSVLCPGFINTRILDSGKHLPERFGGGGDRPTPDAENGLNNLRDLLAQGIDPFYVGELVREGIENDWDYIFTDNQFEPNIDARFAAIKAGFDRIRDRTPLR